MMKTYIILSVCMIACFLQFTKANEECLKYMEEMYNNVKDRAAKGEFKCMDEVDMPAPSGTHEEYQKKMCEEIKNLKNKSEDDKKLFIGCMQEIAQKAKLTRDEPEGCREMMEEEAKKCK